MKKNNNSFSWRDFAVGALTAFAICGCIGIFYLAGIVSDKQSTSTTVSENTVDPTAQQSEEEVVEYDTDIAEFDIKCEDGTEHHFNTPEGFYSLSDQYIANLRKYYGVETLPGDNVVVVGDAMSPYDSGTVINASSLSQIREMLKELYGDDYNEDDILYSEAYTYMTTGELPESLPDNYEIDELATYTVNGIKYVTYEVNYDTTYETKSDDTTVSENTTETVHTQQLACYSKSEDSMEIIVYMQEFDRDTALSYLQEFIGYTE